MVEQKIIDYVRNAVEKGFSFEDIAQLLKKYNYAQRDIDEALWLVSREVKEKEEKKEGKKEKKKAEKKIELPSLPSIENIPEMPEHIMPAKIKVIPEIESKVEDKIQQKFFPEKERKKHLVWVILEIIGGVILFAAVGILMYLFMWPALLNVR